MSGNRGRRGGHRRNDRQKPSIGEAGREVLSNIGEDSLVLQSFRKYAAELDDKHDRYERLVKLSRDITIESKRIIFLLHTVDREDKRTTVLKEAEERLNTLCRVHFKSIAKELQGKEPYQYGRAYTAGLQEFIESLTFYQYLKDGTFEDWTKVQERLTYNKSDIDKWDIHKKPSKPHLKTDDDVDKEETEQSETVIEKPISNLDAEETAKDNPITSESEEMSEDANTKADEQIVTFVSPSDFILGLGDLTGEIMRKCINSIGAGDIDACFEACAFVRQMHKGFLSIPPGGHKEISRKGYTLRQSCSKIETVCYNIKVRGNESSLWGLVDTNQAVEENEDEGYY